MPSYKGHLLGYCVVAAAFTLANNKLALLPPFDFSVWVLAVAVGGFYTLLPDVDTPASKARRIVESGLLSLIILLLILYTQLGDMLFVHAAILLAVTLLVLWFVKHRGMVHTPAAALMLSAPLYIVSPLAAGFAFLGYMTHLILDGEVFH